MAESPAAWSSPNTSTKSVGSLRMLEATVISRFGESNQGCSKCERSKTKDAGPKGQLSPYLFQVSQEVAG